MNNLPFTTFVLRLLGYEIRKPSLLLMSMRQFTHGTWMEDRIRQSNLDNYLIQK